MVSKMERVLQGKPLRDAIMEVDENTLTWPDGLVRPPRPTSSSI